ncbi:MAG: phosphoenolpyruvate--protein phosphotransferase [Eubacteriales bacterium]
MIKGIPISQGFAAANAFVYQKRVLRFEENLVEDYSAELEKLKAAIVASIDQIDHIINNACAGDDEKQAIMTAQIEMLEDESFISMAEELIEENKQNAESAISKACQHFYELFSNIDDEYLKARALDLQDVTNRVLENLIYGDYTSNLELKDRCIVVAYELTPSETVQLDRDKVAGIITEIGTRTSHVAIVAKAMGVPLISQIKDIFQSIHTDDFIAMNAVDGIVYVNPNEKDIDRLQKKADEFEKNIKELEKYKGQKTRTKSGKIVQLFANIAGSEEASSAMLNDAEGIGLFRTEFLYMNRDTLPTEEEQYVQYKSVLETMENKTVIVRTLDIGGDKQTACIEFDKEENPFLGNRAIRLCLEEKEMFSAQLRALLRASIFGKLKIMFPMIACIEELLEAKKILIETMRELSGKNIDFDKNIKIGMMIETPASVIMAEDFATEVDFFSIGTNDLLQYAAAADRNNTKVAYLNSDKNPVIWKMISRVIKTAHKHNIEVGVCGELANTPANSCILTAMGIDELSVSPANILSTRSAIINMDEEQTLKKLTDIVNAKTMVEVYNILK